uniref:Iron-sulfur cluster co-chaperone protein HscB, mitochondrial n=2 Tax=Cacopsylla melanoneura TaxID=428564 RepID=A0A8D8TFZ0_9HEMI
MFKSNRYLFISTGLTLLTVTNCRTIHSTTTSTTENPYTTEPAFDGILSHFEGPIRPKAWGPMRCWNCSTPHRRQVVFCDSCSEVQKHEPRFNHFEQFGMPVFYSIDTDTLFCRFIDRQYKLLDPANFENKTEHAGDICAAHARYMNNAHSTLKNPVTRGLYLLELRGIHVPPNAKPSNRDLVEHVATLTAQMYNVTRNSTIEDLDRLDLKVKIRKQCDELQNEIVRSFNRVDWKAAKEALLGLKAYRQLWQEMVEHRKEVKGFVYRDFIILTSL